MPKPYLLHFPVHIFNLSPLHRSFFLAILIQRLFLKLSNSLHNSWPVSPSIISKVLLIFKMSRALVPPQPRTVYETYNTWHEILCLHLVDQGLKEAWYRFFWLHLLTVSFLFLKIQSWMVFIGGLLFKVATWVQLVNWVLTLASLIFWTLSSAWV